MRHNNKAPEQKGLTVQVRNGDFAFALRKFKKKVAEDGVLQQLREREFYTKPSEKRAKAKKAGIARWKKKQALSDEFAPASPRTNKKTKKR
jgi:small subunit ribosomal protein S21